MQTSINGYRATLCGKVIGPRGSPVGTVNSSGYLHFHCRGAAKSHNYNHRYIYEHFKGAIPAGLVIDHINGDKTDNRISNLEAVTQATNVARGRNNKLSDEQRQDIRSMSDKSNQELAEAFGVSKRTIVRTKSHG